MSTKGVQQSTLDQFCFIAKTTRNKISIRSNGNNNGSNKKIKLKLNNSNNDTKTLTQIYCPKLIYIYISIDIIHN